MKKRWTWLMVLGAAALVAVGVFAGTALAAGPRKASAADQIATTTQQAADQAIAGCPHGRQLGSMMAAGLRNQVTLQRIAGALGITVDDLKTQLQNGQTVAQIAQANSVDLSTVVDAAVAPISDMLSVAVKYGYMTQETADARFAAVKTRVQQAFEIAHPNLNSNNATRTPGNNGNGYGRGYGMMGGGMMGGFQGRGLVPSTPGPDVPGFGPGMMGGSGSYGGMMGGGYGRGMMGGGMMGGAYGNTITN